MIHISNSNDDDENDEIRFKLYLNKITIHVSLQFPGLASAHCSCVCRQFNRAITQYHTFHKSSFTKEVVKKIFF